MRRLTRRGWALVGMLAMPCALAFLLWAPDSAAFAASKSILCGGMVGVLVLCLAGMTPRRQR